jgi:hypothetical protein
VPPELPASYPFACECGRAGCSAFVNLALPAYEASRQVLAAGH